MSETPTRETVISQAHDSVSRVIQGETVLLTPEDSTVHVLDAVGTRIWELCARPVSVGDITDVIVAEYDVDAPTAERDVCSFVAQLMDLGVIVAGGTVDA